MTFANRYLNLWERRVGRVERSVVPVRGSRSYEGAAVFVAGAGGGIGRQTAITLSESGARVACLDLDRESVEETLAQLPGDGVALTGDITKLDSLSQFLNDAEDALGPLTALANLVAVLKRVSVTDVTEDLWDTHLDVNAKASFFLGREFAERLRARNATGAVVFTASQSWWTGGLDGSVVYGASKGALVSLTRGLARHYGPAGIRFNVVAPGFVDTAMLHSGLDDGAMERMISAVPLGRLADPAEVADAIAYLMSPASSYVTGATLVVSGGQLMY